MHLVEFLNFLLNNVFVPKVIYILALLGSISYLIIFRIQKRFSQTNLPDLISTGFQIVSIISGCRLVIRVFIDLCKPGVIMEMDKFYTGYGGAAVIWISIVTLRKRFKN